MGVASMLSELETLAMQATCRFMYTTGVPRTLSSFSIHDQVRYIIMKKNQIHYVTIVISYNNRTEKLREIKHQILDIHEDKFVTIQDGLDILAFTSLLNIEQPNVVMEVFRYSGLQETNGHV